MGRKIHFCICAGKGEDGLCPCQRRHSETAIAFHGQPRAIYAMQGLVASDIQQQSYERNAARGLRPFVPADPGAWKDEPLAVIGSGPSVAERIDELRAWPGPRWAVNNAFQWCREHGIEAMFLTMDPGPADPTWRWDFRPGEKAMVALTCDPGLFDALDHCDVTVFGNGEHGIASASTSASAALTLGPLLGYRKVTFFGCESSRAEGMTHVHGNHTAERWLLIECGGQRYVTNPQMALQAEGMAMIIRACPHVFAERSGGFLRALIENAGEYDLIASSDQIGEIPPPMPDADEIARETARADPAWKPTPEHSHVAE
jgi:hypothetical protein